MSPNAGAANATIAVDTVGLSANNVIVILSYCEHSGGGPAISSVSGGGLTWVQRSRSHGSGQGSLEVWYAKITGTLAVSTITVTYASAFDGGAVLALSIVGCSSAVWDANASLPAKQSNTAASWTPGVTISTSQAHDMMLAAACSNNTINSATGGSVPAGFSLVDFFTAAGSGASAQMGVGSQARSTTQSGATIAWGGLLTDAGTSATTGGEYLVDALTADLAGNAYSLAAAEGTTRPAGQTQPFISLHRNLAAAEGTYALQGRGAAMGKANKAGAYALAGQPIGMNVGRSLAAASGAYALAGQAQHFGRSRPAASGSYTLTGKPITNPVHLSLWPARDHQQTGFVGTVLIKVPAPGFVDPTAFEHLPRRRRPDEDAIGALPRPHGRGTFRPCSLPGHLLHHSSPRR